MKKYTAKQIENEIEYIHRVKFNLTISKDLSNTIKRLVKLEKLKVFNYMLDEDFRHNYKTKKELINFFNLK